MNPWSTVAITSDDLFRDVQATFISTYRNVIGANSNLAKVMRLGVSSTQRKSRYGYAESPPTIDRVGIGEALASDAFRYIAYEVENLTWGKAIDYFEEDVEDLELSSIMDDARRLATRAAQIPEEVLFQMLVGSASSRLLESIPLAPDGAALFAATAGGAARFGVSGGNIVSGSGVATGAAIRSDFWQLIERFRLFQDTEGQPLLSDDIAKVGCTIIYSVENDEAIAEAFEQKITQQTITGQGVAAVENTIMVRGIPITLWGTQRLQGNNDIFVSINGTPEGPRPVFEQVRRGVRVMDETRENSSRARRARILSTLVDMRSGFGINLPYLFGAINN